MHTMISQTTGLSTKNSTPQNCRRCSGHVIREMCSDLDSDCGYSTFWAHRCIQCGDITDEVILRNRSMFIPEAMSAAAA